MNSLTRNRFNMIEQQIRTWEVLDPVVLDLLEKVPREKFVSRAYQGVAFADTMLPIGEGECMLSPKIEARIVQTLSLKKSDRVRLIGTGSGYLAALMAKLSHSVVSLDVHRSFTTSAKKICHSLGIHNIQFETGDGLDESYLKTPFDVIVCTGSIEEEPKGLRNSLAIGGRLFIFLGDAQFSKATLIQKISEGIFQEEVIFETEMPALVTHHVNNKFIF